MRAAAADTTASYTISRTPEIAPSPSSYSTQTLQGNTVMCIYVLNMHQVINAFMCNIIILVQYPGTIHCTGPVYSHTVSSFDN